MIFTTLLAGCNSHPSFKTSDEAIDACKNELVELRDKKDVDIKALTEIASSWLELQDSSYSVFSKDSSVTLKSPTALAFFLVSDSIKAEIRRLALATPRSMKDVMYLKVNAVRGRNKIEKSETYKDAVAFYEKLDDVAPIENVDVILSTYMKVLRSSSKGFKKEQDLINFLAAEDKCFRSLMLHLSDVNTEKLQVLTQATGEIFDKFYPVIGSRQNALNDRTMLYLTMRFNRRVVQNALACKDDVETGKNLTRDQKANYKWMLIQPYIAIDDYSTAVLTDKQRKQLIDLSVKLPELLQKLDSGKEQMDSEENLTKVLSTYFLKSYLNTTL